MDYKWFEDLLEESPETRKKLPPDLTQIIDLIGMGNMLKLMSVYHKSNIYFSEKQFAKIKIEYVRLHPALSARELARKLNCSERFVYKMRERMIN